MARKTSKDNFLNRTARLRKLGPLKPRFHFGLRIGRRNQEEVVTLPFIRSPVAIVIVGAFLAAFSIPYFTMGDFLTGLGEESLFDLVFSLFSLFWLLGWSVGVAILLLFFLLVTIGSETLVIRPGGVLIRVEVLRLGLGAEFRAEGIENLRWRRHQEVETGPEAGNSFRRDHLAFDYGGETIGVGSALDRDEALRLATLITSVAIEKSPGLVADQTEPEQENTQTFSDSPDTLKTARSEAPPPGLHSTSTRVLILANLIPLAGVLLDDWSIGEIMLLFWAESAIIGFYNVLRMWVLGRWSALFYGPFFIGHYGGFMVGHLLFIYALFLSGMESMDPTVSQVLADFLQLWPALLGLFISHGVSFRLNFLGRGEYLHTDIREQMSAPYKRIIIMHLTIIFGGFLVMAFNTPLLALLLLILLKIIVDTRAHIGEHTKA